jgi:hypothetical protein
MPVTGSPPSNNYGSFYAINGDWIEPTSQAELEALLQPIRAYQKNMIVVFNPPHDSRATIDWTVIRDQLLPQANDWLDGELNHRYAVPLRKTKKAGTQYDMNIVNAAALYVAQRIESRTFAGAAMPNESPYADKLTEMRDVLLQDLKLGIRLRGQHLKGRNRFVDPNAEPYEEPGQGATGGKGHFVAKTNTPTV